MTSNAWKRARSPEEKREERQIKKNRYPEKWRARRTLYHAVRRGQLFRPDHCTKCGVIGTPHGHHEDYKKPLEVIWVCGLCHARIHGAQSRSAALAVGPRETRDAKL
jgi:hypothetical protein